MKKDYAGMKWKDLTEEEKNMMLKEADAIDGRDGNRVKTGECIVDLVYPFSVPGYVEEGEIMIEDDAVIYNPCIFDDFDEEE